MSSDRLAAMRIDRRNYYEMGGVNTPPPEVMPAFYATISSIQDDLKEFNDNVAGIQDCRLKSLDNMDDAVAGQNAAQLDELFKDNSALSATLKKRIKDLEAQKGSGRDGQIRQQQTALVKSKFVEAIQNYQVVEQQYHTKYKQRLERQIRIVKPDATPEEVKAMVNSDEYDGKIFSQADRYTDPKKTYVEVKDRHEDFKRIENILVELAKLFNDMAVYVEQQDGIVGEIYANADVVVKDTEAGETYTDKAVKSARGARKKRWICFFIILVVLAVVAIIIGVLVSNKHNSS